MLKMRNTTFDEIEMGASATLTRTPSETDVEVLALVSGDANPFYIQEEGASDARADENITQVVGGIGFHICRTRNKTPGSGMKIVEQNLRFHGTLP
jgi:acyl dehydratase